MIKLLIEKDKTKISDEILKLIENKIPRTFIKKQEDKKYILLYISLESNTKKYRRKKSAKLISSTASVIAQYIITHMTKRFASETLSSMHFITCNGLDKDRICNIVCDDIIKNIRYDLKHKKSNNRYSILYRRILKNMLECDIFAVNAFIRFRIDDYKGFIHEYTLSAVERFNRENKYIEFIESLQYFVDTRASKINEIVITVDSCGYTLTDSYGTPIDISLYEQAKDDNTDKEDLLMGILLTAVPKKITVCADEGFYDSDFFSSLTNIFGNRLQTYYTSE